MKIYKTKVENQKQLFHIFYQIWQIGIKKVHAIRLICGKFSMY